MNGFRRTSVWLAAILWVAGLALAGRTAGPGEFRFSILGDRTGEAVPGVYESAWREVARLHPDFAINVGDTIQGGNDARLDTEWQAVRAIFKRYPYQLFLTPGNHDIWSEASLRAWRKQTGRPPSYSFDWRQAHFTVLDNSRTQELSKEQLQFLEADLKANRERSPKFVFLHKPFWLLYLTLGSGEFDLHRIARQYGVAFVFSGHLHQFVTRERDGIAYTVVGSSGAALGHNGVRNQGHQEGWFYHHLLVTVTGNRAAVTVKELDPPYGQGRALPLGRWSRQ